MKRAKLMLAAIAVFAVVGGVYASKAKDSSKRVFTHAPNDPITKCTVPLTGITTIPNTQPVVLSATIATNLPCTVSTFYSTL